MEKLNLVIISSFLVNSAFGSLSWSSEVTVPVDTCVTDGSSYSMIYRCTDDSLWKYLYSPSTSCTGVASATLWGGCDDYNTNTIAVVDNCTASQKLAKSGDCKYLLTSGSLYALDVCYNTGTTSSRMYTCINGQPWYNQYNAADCSGTPTGVNVTSYDNVRCSGDDCHARARKFTVTSSDYCNYDESNYGEPGTSNCNYFTSSNGGYPFATGKCFSFRQGNYKYSKKYECYQVNGEWEVAEYDYLDNNNCNNDGSKYLVNNYTSANYTIHCGYRDCGTTVRTYYGGNSLSCPTELNNHRSSYTETPIALDQCLKYYNDPDNAAYLNNTSPYNSQYYMYVCIDGYLGIYYFLDKDCKDINTFYVYNTSGNNCPTVIDGCTKSAGHMIGFNLFIFVFLFISQLFY